MCIRGFILEINIATPVLWMMYNDEEVQAFQAKIKGEDQVVKSCLSPKFFSFFLTFFLFFSLLFYADISSPKCF